MNTYLIPKEGKNQKEYFEYVSSLDWNFTSDRNLEIDFFKELVTLSGTISGFVQVTIQSSMAEIFLDKNVFMDRFTINELASILSSSNPLVKVFLQRFNSAGPDNNVSLTSSRTIEGVNLLETLGIIAVGRAAEILKV